MPLLAGPGELKEASDAVPRLRIHAGQSDVSSSCRAAVRCVDYLVSHPRRTCFWASCFACFAARFSLRVRLGFFGWLDGVDLVAMRPPYIRPSRSGSADRSGSSRGRCRRDRGRGSVPPAPSVAHFVRSAEPRRVIDACTETQDARSTRTVSRSVAITRTTAAFRARSGCQRLSAR